jgi:hypothetical protein
MWPWGTIGYVIVALVWWRMLAGWIAWDGQAYHEEPRPDWDIGIGLGGLGALIWPATVTLCLVSWAWTVAPVSWPLAVGAERARRRFEREQKAAEQRNRDLREVGIGQ